MKLGQQALEALQAEITGRLNPGEDLVVAGEIGISGKKAYSLNTGFPSGPKIGFPSGPTTKFGSNF